MKYFVKTVTILNFIFSLYALPLQSMIQPISTHNSLTTINATHALGHPSLHFQQSFENFETPSMYKNEINKPPAPWFNTYNRVISSITKPIGTSIQKIFDVINPVANRIIPISDIASFFGKSENNSKSDVTITLHDDTKIGCTLVQDLTVTCCTKDDGSDCISFNPLDNDNPWHNCCIADATGVRCSKGLCTQKNAYHAPCTPSQQSLNKPIQFSQINKDILNDLKNIESLMDKPFQTDYSVDVHNNEKILNLAALIHDLESAFNLNEDNIISSIKTIKSSNNGHAFITTSTSKLNPHITIAKNFLYLYKYFPLDSTLAHEIAHAYQNQLKCIRPSSACKRSMPGYEMDADILGALALLGKNPDSILHAAIDQANARELNPATTIPNLLCSQPLFDINRSNAASYKQLLSISDGDPHPHDRVRLTILLKLHTMMRAYLQYVAPLYEENIEAMTRSKAPLHELLPLDDLISLLEDLALKNSLDENGQYSGQARARSIEKATEIIQKALLNKDYLKAALGAYQALLDNDMTQNSHVEELFNALLEKYDSLNDEEESFITAGPAPSLAVLVITTILIIRYFNSKQQEQRKKKSKRRQKRQIIQCQQRYFDEQALDEFYN